MDNEDDKKEAGIAVGRGNDWLDNEHRQLSLIKAVEARTHGDDDQAIIARAGRFLNFLKNGG